MVCYFISQIIRSYFKHGVISRASKCLEIVNPADFNAKGFKGVDSAPYGGGPGMVMRADVLAETLDQTVLKGSLGVKAEMRLHVIYTSPVGEKWDSEHAKKFSSLYNSWFYKGTSIHLRSL